MPDAPHPLLPVLLSAADGVFPAVDGGVTVVPPLADGLEAVVSFTGHAYLATALPAAAFGDLAPDGFGAALSPQLLLRLAGPAGRVGVLDCTLAARGTGGGDLPLRADVAAHPRVRYAQEVRREVRVHGDDRGFVTVARGVAGRTELSIEAARPGAGAGASLLADALGLVPRGEPVFAAVTPGNARSLRAFLDAGFRPIGSEVLVVPRRV